MPPDRSRDIDELRTVPFFAGLDGDQLAELAASGRRVVFDAGTVVFEEGDEPDGMYVVLSGTVRVYRRDDDGHEVELTTRDRGDFFGEIALIENRPRSASVATIDRSELFVLDRAAFAGLLTRADATLVFDVLAALSRMVRERGDSVWRQELARREVETRMEIERHRALARMVAGVAHELNTPLGIANTAAGIIESRLGAPAVAERLGGDPATSSLVEDALEASGLVRRSVDRAHRLVQTFKQISVGSLSGTIESVDIGAVVADTVELFRLNARLAKLAVEVRDERAQPGSRWNGYPGYLSQVLLNLLTNVERYAYGEGVEGRVEIDLADDRGDDGYVVTVRDFGQGIESDVLGQVFEPFFTTGRSRGGTGLGLTIVHNLVTTALQGTIEIESDVGRGTTVTIRLPDLEREADRSESQAPLR